MNSYTNIILKTTRLEASTASTKISKEYTVPVDYITCTQEQVEKYVKRRKK